MAGVSGAVMAGMVATGADKPAQERFAKCELHMHTTRSDGNATPLQAAQIYNDKGFNVCIFTDHIVDWCYGGYFNPTDMFNDKELNDYISIPGSELSVALKNRYDRPIEVHINALGLDFPMMPSYTGNIVDEIRENVRLSWDAGAVAQVNHPNFLWSFDYVELSQINDPYILELVNQDPGCNNYGDLSRPSVEQIWDALLSEGKRVYGSATDDTHYYYNYEPATSSPGYGWVVCQVPELNRTNILNALRLGKFYASTGPELESYSVDGRTIKVKVKPQDKQNFRIKFIGRYGQILHDVEGLEASYTIKGDEYYVRVRVGDDAENTVSASGIPGQALYCQPIFVADLDAKDAFAPQVADFSAKAANAALAVKFGGAAENFLTVDESSVYNGSNPGWRTAGYLHKGENLLPDLTPVQQGFVTAELPGTLQFNLPAGGYKATLLIGESGARIYQPSTMQLELNGRPVLKDLMTKSGDYQLHTFQFRSNGDTQELTFRGLPRYEGDFCRSIWSAAALIIERDETAKNVNNAFFTAEPTVELSADNLELAVPVKVTVRSFFPNWSEAKLNGSLSMPEKMQPYFAVTPVKQEQTATPNGTQFIAEYEVTLIKPFTLQKKMNSTLVGDEYVPEVPEAILFASVTDTNTGSAQSKRFRLPLREPKLKLAATNRDNTFKVELLPVSNRTTSCKLNLTLPESWQLSQPLPAELTAQNGEPVQLEFTVNAPADTNWTEAAAVLNAQIDGADLTAIPFQLRVNGKIGTFAEPGKYEVPGNITRGITMVADLTVPANDPAHTMIMFRAQKYSEVMLYLTAKGEIRAKIEDSIYNYHDRVEAFGPQLESGKTYKVAFTYDKYLGGALYVDGQKVADNFGDFNVVDIMDNSAPLELADSVKNVTLYNYMLTDAEVAELK